MDVFYDMRRKPAHSRASRNELYTGVPQLRVHLGWLKPRMYYRMRPSALDLELAWTEEQRLPRMGTSEA